MQWQRKDSVELHVSHVQTYGFVGGGSGKENVGPGATFSGCDGGWGAVQWNRGLGVLVLCLQVVTNAVCMNHYHLFFGHKEHQATTLHNTAHCNETLRER